MFRYSCVYVYVLLLLCTSCSVYCFIILFYVLFMRECVLNYCNRVSTQLQLNISPHIIIIEFEDYYL